MPYASKETITQIAIDRWKSTRDPRLRTIMTTLIRHLHDFVREVDLTQDEWLKAAEWLAATGRMCSDNRNEFILASDVLGLSMAVVMENDRGGAGATPNTVIGPFYVEGSPEFANGACMSENVPGEPCYVVGKVKDTEGKPIAGVALDIWQADCEGIYEAQIPDQAEPRLRAVYHSGPDGSYCISTVVPLGYSIPLDGPIGALIKRTEISPMRPSHIHFLIQHPGYDRVITHLFKRGDPYIETDVVYGVKKELIVDFERMPAGKTPTGEESKVPFSVVHYDFVLSRSAAAAKPAGKAA